MNTTINRTLNLNNCQQTAEHLNESRVTESQRELTYSEISVLLSKATPNSVAEKIEHIGFMPFYTQFLTLADGRRVFKCFEEDGTVIYVRDCATFQFIYQNEYDGSVLFHHSKPEYFGESTPTDVVISNMLEIAWGLFAIGAFYVP